MGIYNEEDTRYLIRCVVKDLVSDFLYYDRKEDEELQLHMIENAVAECVITIDEMIELFSSELRENIEEKNVGA